MARGGGEHSPTFKAVGQRSQQEQEERLLPLCSSSPFNKVGITNYNKLYGRAVWSHRTLTSQDLLIQYIQYAHPIPTTWFWPIRGHQRPLWHEWQLQYVVHYHTWAIPAVIPSLHGLQQPLTDCTSHQWEHTARYGARSLWLWVWEGSRGEWELVLLDDCGFLIE